MARRVIIDTDTAGDDTQAILLACLTERLSVDAVTIVAGNVPFDRQVENAKYALSRVGAERTPVYEGARTAPQRLSPRRGHSWRGWAGRRSVSRDRHPVGRRVCARRDCASLSGSARAVYAVVYRSAYKSGPGPEPRARSARTRGRSVGDGRGGALRGQCVTPAAEYNVWVDPDAAKRVFDAFEITLVDWGVSLRDSLLPPAGIEAVLHMEGELPAFISGMIETVYEFTRTEQGIDGVPQPDSLTAALLAYPELRGEMSTYPVAVDEREGLTRGYLSVDEDGVTEAPARTRVVESANGERFCTVVLSMLRDRAPDRVLSS